MTDSVLLGIVLAVLAVRIGMFLRDVARDSLRDLRERASQRPTSGIATVVVLAGSNEKELGVTLRSLSKLTSPVVIINDCAQPEMRRACKAYIKAQDISHWRFVDCRKPRSFEQALGAARRHVLTDTVAALPAGIKMRTDGHALHVAACSGKPMALRALPVGAGWTIKSNVSRLTDVMSGRQHNDMTTTVSKTTALVFRKCDYAKVTAGTEVNYNRAGYPYLYAALSPATKLQTASRPRERAATVARAVMGILESLAVLYAFYVAYVLGNTDLLWLGVAAAAFIIAYKIVHAPRLQTLDKARLVAALPAITIGYFVFSVIKTASMVARPFIELYSFLFIRRQLISR